MCVPPTQCSDIGTYVFFGADTCLLIGTFTSYLDQSEFEMWRCDTELFKPPQRIKEYWGMFTFQSYPLESTYIFLQNFFKNINPLVFSIFSLFKEQTEQRSNKRERRGTEESPAPAYYQTITPSQNFQQQRLRKKERKRTAS